VLLIKAYKEGKSGNDLKELDMFVKQIKTVIEQSLEREVKLELWSERKKQHQKQRNKKRKESSLIQMNALNFFAKTF